MSTRSASLKVAWDRRRVHPLERFLSKVDKDGHDGCWIWQGGKDSNGYGVFWMSGKSLKANRQSWRFFRGELSSKSMILHRCDNKACVNPDHLRIGTHEDNMRDAHERDRFWKGSRHPRFVMYPGLIDRMQDLQRSGETIMNICRHLQIDRSTYFDWKRASA